MCLFRKSCLYYVLKKSSKIWFLDTSINRTSHNISICTVHPPKMLFFVTFFYCDIINLLCFTTVTFCPFNILLPRNVVSVTFFALKRNVDVLSLVACHWGASGNVWRWDLTFWRGDGQNVIMIVESFVSSFVHCILLIIYKLKTCVFPLNL